MPLSLIFVIFTVIGLILPLIKRRITTMLNLTLVMQALLWVFLLLIGSGAVRALHLPIYENTASLGSGVSISLMLGKTEFYALLAIVSVLLLFTLSAYRFLQTVSHISILMLHFNLVGVLGIVLTRDIFNLYIFIEIFTLTLIGMIKAKDTHNSTIQTVIFLFVNGVASAILLLGAVMIYRNFGVLNLNVILSDPAILMHRDTALASALIFTAVLVKMMQFPLGFWAKPILSTGSYPARAYIGIIVPMVFTYELIKLSPLIQGGVMFFILATALINIFWSLSRLICSKDVIEAFPWLCFCLASLYVLGALLLMNFPVFGWIGILVLGTSLLKLIMLRISARDHDPAPIDQANDQIAQIDGSDLSSAIQYSVAYLCAFLIVTALW